MISSSVSLSLFSALVWSACGMLSHSGGVGFVGGKLYLNFLAHTQRMLWGPSIMFIVPRCGFVYSSLLGILGSSGPYGFMILSILFAFLFTRVPYIYGLGGFGLFLFFWIAPLFLSFFFSRLSVFGFSDFLSSFVPLGTPLWISPLVVLAETVSYLVRPFVLLLRPFLNISIGSFGGVALGSFFFASEGILVFLFILFFYEVFVAVVHWFIVCNILSFSKDH